MRVLQLWRFPVKSLQGEQVDAAELGPAGLRFAIFDVATGFVLTALDEAVAPAGRCADRAPVPDNRAA